MKTIPSEINEQLKSEYYRPAILVTLSANYSSLFFTSWSEPIKVGPNLFYPRGMSISSINKGSGNVVSKCEMELDDIDRAIYSSLSVYSQDSSECYVSLCVINKTGLVIGEEFTELFWGEIAGWSYVPGRISLSLSSILLKWGAETTRLFSSSCSVKVFKSSQCGYTGAATKCDRTYETCKAYNNDVNFRGFRWLDGMSKQELE